MNATTIQRSDFGQWLTLAVVVLTGIAMYHQIRVSRIAIKKHLEDTDAMKQAELASQRKSEFINPSNKQPHNFITDGNYRQYQKN